MNTEPSFRLTVRIGPDLSETDAAEVRAALAASGAEGLLTRREARGGAYWQIGLGSADRPETLIERLTGLGWELARTIARTTRGEADAVHLSLLQEVDDVEDHQQTGIWFTADAVKWAALAGASIDIDQYLYLD